VTIGLSSSDTTEGTVSPASVTFTTANWLTPQTVTVTGVNDSIVDGNVAYTIVTAAATSTDTNYNGINASDVSVTNNDDDVAALIIRMPSGTPYSTIQSAYIDAANGDILEMQAITFDESPDFNRTNISVFLKGGNDSTFNSQIGMTTIHGSMNISAGTIKVENLKIN
jgi:hypothetical protein